MTNDELAIAIQNGNTDQICQLCEQCKGFVYKEACRWTAAFSYRPDIELEDLTQSAFFAILEAVQRFNPEKGTFITLLSMTLKTAFSECYGVRTKAAQLNPLNSSISLDAPVSGSAENDLCFGDTIQDVEAETAFEKIERGEVQQQLSTLLAKALSIIPQREAETLNQYFFQGITQADIAAKMGTTTSYVGQLIHNGLKRLRQCSMTNKLSEMLYGEMNLFRHSGYQSWENSGYSQPEYMFEKKEKRLQEICFGQVGTG